MELMLFLVQRVEANCGFQDYETKPTLNSDDLPASGSNLPTACGSSRVSVSCRNCLFRALGDQLQGHSRDHLRLRQETVHYMTSHRQDFEPFVEDDVPFVQHCERLDK